MSTSGGGSDVPARGEEKRREGWDVGREDAGMRRMGGYFGFRDGVGVSCGCQLIDMVSLGHRESLS